MTKGWVVKLDLTGGGQARPLMNLYDAAVADPSEAVEAVKAYLGRKDTQPGESFTAVEELSESAVAALGLKEGDVKERDLSA